MVRTRVVVSVLVGLAACGGIGNSPGEVSWDGVRLKRETTWGTEGVRGVVYIPEGQVLESADVRRVAGLAGREQARS
jgi:hypothetical protein